jgi:hypothetical protein
LLTATLPGDAKPQTVHAVTDNQGKFTVVAAFKGGSYAGLTLSAEINGAMYEKNTPAFEIVADAIADLGPIAIQPAVPDGN